ncbi:hypothetical protein K2X33_15975 [bacterium]|nr:hypothetical protein [bacterium]
MALVSRNSYAFSPLTAKGGLIHVPSPANGSTYTAFQTSLRRASAPGAYLIWIAQGGLLYAESLQKQSAVPVDRLLIVQARESAEVWRVGLEALQTGLFGSVFLRADQACAPAHLRKLQLAAEKMRCEVFLLTPAALPHWLLKETLHPTPNYAHPLLHQPAPPAGLRRELPETHAESVPV